MFLLPKKVNPLAGGKPIVPATMLMKKHKPIAKHFWEAFSACSVFSERLSFAALLDRAGRKRYSFLRKELLGKAEAKAVNRARRRAVAPYRNTAVRSAAVPTATRKTST